MINAMVAKPEKQVTIPLEESPLAKLLENHFKVIFSTDPVVYRLLVDEQIQALMSNSEMSEIEVKKVVYQIVKDSLADLLNETKGNLNAIINYLHWTYYVALLNLKDEDGKEDPLTAKIHGYRVSILDRQTIQTMKLSRQQLSDIYRAIEIFKNTCGSYNELEAIMLILKKKIDETTT